MVGLACLGGGLLVLLLYGLYGLLKDLGHVDPVVFIGGAGIAAGIIILLVSTAAERTSLDRENIKEEDMKP
jgi:hypothetical protein